MNSLSTEGDYSMGGIGGMLEKRRRTYGNNRQQDQQQGYNQAINNVGSDIYLRLNHRPVDEILRESEAFFMREGKVHRTLERLAQALEEESIPYVIMNDMAVTCSGKCDQVK